MPGDKPKIYGSQVQAKAGDQVPRPPKDIDMVASNPLEVANKIADLIAKQNLFPKRMVTVREQSEGSVGIYISKLGEGQPEVAIEVRKGPKPPRKSRLCLLDPWDMVFYVTTMLPVALAAGAFGHWLASVGV